MFCNECGSENRNDRKFCSECGKPLKDYTKPRENLVMPENVSKAKAKVEKKNRLNKAFNITLLILLISAISLTIFSFITKNTIQMVLISIGIACYVAFFIVLIVKRTKLKKL